MAVSSIQANQSPSPRGSLKKADRAGGGGEDELFEECVSSLFQQILNGEILQQKNSDTEQNANYDAPGMAYINGSLQEKYKGMFLYNREGLAAGEAFTGKDLIDASIHEGAGGFPELEGINLNMDFIKEYGQAEIDAAVQQLQSGISNGGTSDGTGMLKSFLQQYFSHGESIEENYVPDSIKAATDKNAVEGLTNSIEASGKESKDPKLSASGEAKNAGFSLKDTTVQEVKGSGTSISNEVKAADIDLQKQGDQKEQDATSYDDVSSMDSYLSEKAPQDDIKRNFSDNGMIHNGAITSGTNKSNFTEAMDDHGGLPTAPEISKDNIDRIVKSFKALRLPDSTELRVKLTPEELGEVTVKVVLEKGRISGNITADSKEAALMLQSKLDLLKEEMALKNVNLSNISVNVFTGNGDENGRQSSREFLNKHGQKSGSFHEYQTDIEDDEEYQDNNLNIIA